MKFVALLLPALVASAAVLEVRQLGGTRSGKSTGKSVAKTPGSTGGSQGKFGTAKVAGTRKLTPVVNPQAQREITRFGPLTLNAVGLYHFHSRLILATDVNAPLEKGRCQR